MSSVYVSFIHNQHQLEKYLYFLPVHKSLHY